MRTSQNSITNWICRIGGRNWQDKILLTSFQTQLAITFCWRCCVVVVSNHIRSMDFLVRSKHFSITHWIDDLLLFFVTSIWDVMSDKGDFLNHTKSYTPFCSEFYFSQNQQSVFGIVRPMLNIRRKFLHSHSLPIYFFLDSKLFEQSFAVKRFSSDEVILKKNHFPLPEQMRFVCFLKKFCNYLKFEFFFADFLNIANPMRMLFFFISNFSKKKLFHLETEFIRSIFFLKFSNGMKKNRYTHLCLMQSKVNILNGATDKK